MKIRAIANDGTKSDIYEPLPTSVIGFKFSWVRAGHTIQWCGLSYEVVEDNYGGKIDGC